MINLLVFRLLKDKVRCLLNTNKEIKNLSVDSYNSYHSYINSFVVYNNVLNEICISDSITLDNTDTKK